MRRQLELVPTEYHLSFFETVVDADWTEFQQFLDAVGSSSDVPNYEKFTTNRSRVEIVRELARILPAWPDEVTSNARDCPEGNTALLIARSCKL